MKIAHDPDLITHQPSRVNNFQGWTQREGIALADDAWHAEGLFGSNDPRRAFDHCIKPPSMMLILRLHDTTGCQTGCTTGMKTGYIV